MTQADLSQFAFPQEGEDAEEAVRNPTMYAECLGCGLALENRRMHNASGVGSDREGVWRFACGNRFCDPYTSDYSGVGKGSASVTVKEGEIVETQTNRNAVEVSAGMVEGTTETGTPIIDSQKYEAVMAESEEEDEN